MATAIDSDIDSVSTKLSEKDILGASLHGRDPSSLKFAELKSWLLCSSKGGKERFLP
jgi:hypothetical protein